MTVVMDVVEDMLNDHAKRIAALEGHMEAPAEAEPPPRVPFVWELDVDDRRVTFKCTHIDESLRGTVRLGKHGDLRVESSACPCIKDGTVVWLRGDNKRKDGQTASRCAPTHAEAVAYRDRAQAALEHVRDEIAARWKVEAEPDVEADEQAAIAAFEERWRLIVGMRVQVLRAQCGNTPSVVRYDKEFILWDHGTFDPVASEAFMRAWFEDHVATLSIKAIDDVWKERQGEAIYPYWFLAGGATRLGASRPTPKRYQAQIFIGNMLVGESDISPDDALRKAHILASIAWAEMQVAK